MVKVKIPESHPRRESLLYRDKIVEGLDEGIVSKEGLIAHGRGEAFDYLLGEKTVEEALDAEKAGVAAMLLGRSSAISVNGNTAALAPEKLIELSELLDAPLEVNLFYKSEERVERIIAHLKKHGASRVLGRKGDAKLPIESERAKVDSDGIYRADVVLVALEDGDRTEALEKMGKSVVAIDLNPLSRTAQKAAISIIDELSRALDNMIDMARFMRDLSADELNSVLESYDNDRILKSTLEKIAKGLMMLGLESR